jgi:hypothetical protein
MRRALASIAAVMLSLAFADEAPGDSAMLGGGVYADAAWIAQAQLRDGAIATQLDRK